MAKRRKLTAGEQTKLLDDLYEEIYHEDLPFHGEGIHFEAENDSETDDVAEEDENVAAGEETVDVNLDTDIPDDERDSDSEDPLPRKRKYKSQKDLLNDEMYEKLPDQPVKTFVWSNKSGDRREWTTNKPSAENIPRNAGRRSAKDISLAGGPTRFAKLNSKTILETWSSMITDDILMKVVDFTNKRMQVFLTSIKDTLDKTDKKTHYKLTSLLELKAWFGLFYVRAALHLNGVDCDNVWYHDSANDLFVCTMQRKRFSVLSHFIQFDDCQTRATRWKTDTFACFREYFEAINNRFAILRRPSQHTAIDETLYPYRGKIGFKQYNPSKPGKYGLLYRSFCDSEVQYTYFSLPYAGKPEEAPDQYYVTGTDNYTKYLVDNVIRIAGADSVKGRNISLDRYFTSMTIAEWCLERNITITGTMRKDRIGIPRELQKMLTSAYFRNVMNISKTYLAIR